VRTLVLDIDGQGHSVVRRLERHDVEAEAVDPGRMAGVVEEADLVIVEAAATGDGAALVDVGSVGLAATARALHRPVWLAVGVGRRLPEQYWQAIVERTADPDLPAHLAPFEVLPLGLVDRVAGPDGIGPLEALPGSDTPLCPELLVSLA
jgi:hypothetical protein